MECFKESKFCVVLISEELASTDTAGVVVYDEGVQKLEYKNYPE